LMYGYILSTVSEFFVEYMPRSMAPNVITLLGHICILVMYVSGVFWCRENCELPSWLIFTAAVLYFTWLILDNIDGKQARRTRTSSPLGLIFDH
jgi:ethanolaminephosphotransferase